MVATYSAQNPEENYGGSIKSNNLRNPKAFENENIHKPSQVYCHQKCIEKDRNSLYRYSFDIPQTRPKQTNPIPSFACLLLTSFPMLPPKELVQHHCRLRPKKQRKQIAQVIAHLKRVEEKRKGCLKTSKRFANP